MEATTVDRPRTSHAEKRPARTAPRPATVAIGMLAAAAIAFVLFGRLDAQSPTGDERVYIDAGLAYVQGDLTPNPEHPPLAKLLLGVWQVLVLEGVVGARLLIGVLTLGTAAGVWWMLRRDLGDRGALVPALLVIVADHATGDQQIGRVVTLEAFVVFFTVWGIAFAWRWRTGGSAAWLAAAGVAMSAASLSKVSAVVMFPALLLLLLGPGRPTAARALRGVAAFAAAGLALAAVVLLPFGGIDAVQRMIDFQLEHATTGHYVTIDGVAYQFAPWWATLRYAIDGVGIVPAIGLLVGTVAAWLRPATRVLAATLTAGLGITLVVLMTSPVALAHYFIGWIWIPTVLAGIGLVELALRVRTRSGRLPRGAVLAAATIVAVAAAWSGVASIVRVATAQPSTADLAVDALLDVEGEPLVYVPGYDGWQVLALDGVRFAPDPTQTGITAIIVGDDPRGTPDPALVAFIEQPGVCVDGVLHVDDWMVCSLDGQLAMTPGGYALITD